MALTSLPGASAAFELIYGFKQLLTLPAAEKTIAPALCGALVATPSPKAFTIRVEVLSRQAYGFRKNPHWISETLNRLFPTSRRAFP